MNTPSQQLYTDDDNGTAPEPLSPTCTGVGGETDEAAQIAALRKTFWEAHRAAEKAAHALFAALPVGRDRERAADIYENIRNAPRAS